MKKYYLYIVLIRTNTVLSNMIKLLKKDEYTHAAISLDENIEYMYSFGRKDAYNPFIGRFKQEHINRGIYRFHRYLPGIVIKVGVSKEQYDKAKFLLDDFILNSDMYKYNYKGLLYSLVEKSSYQDDRFLCSEFVYHILYESYIVDFKVSRNLVRPQNLLDIKGEVIYEGNLKDIKSSEEVMDGKLSYLMSKIGINF